MKILVAEDEKQLAHVLAMGQLGRYLEIMRAVRPPLVTVRLLSTMSNSTRMMSSF